MRNIMEVPWVQVDKKYQRVVLEIKKLMMVLPYKVQVAWVPEQGGTDKVAQHDCDGFTAAAASADKWPYAQDTLSLPRNSVCTQY
eukprot:gene9108-9277_t